MAVIEFQDRKTHRLIPARYPTIGVFDEYSSAEDVQIAMELEALTNDRLTSAGGRANAIPKEDWAIGKSGATMAMAAFLHPSPGGGRFNDEKLGAWYASLAVTTAIKETLHHHTKRLRASKGGFPNQMQLRELISRPKVNLYDLTIERDSKPDMYRESDYSKSQDFGEHIRKSVNDGIMYQSVRHQQGTNIVIFRPRLLVPVTQGDHYEYSWDSAGAERVQKMTNVKIAD